MSTEGKESLKTFCYSVGGEMFYELGLFADARSAAKRFFQDHWDNEVVYVGEPGEPCPAEKYIDADLIIEHAQVQDDYSGEWGEDWPGETEEQKRQLTERLQKVFGDWLDEHKLRPNFFMVHEDVKFRRADFPELPPPYAATPDLHE